LPVRSADVAHRVARRRTTAAAEIFEYAGHEGNYSARGMPSAERTDEGATPLEKIRSPNVEYRTLE